MPVNLIIHFDFLHAKQCLMPYVNSEGPNQNVNRHPLWWLGICSSSGALCQMEIMDVQTINSFKILTGQQRSVGLPFCDIRRKKVREKSRECHNHKPKPFPDPKRKRKPTNLNKHKPNKRTKSTKISSLFPKRGNRNTKRTEKHKNKMTHGKTYNKSPRRINHKATKSKTNTGTTALERSVEG